MAEEQRQYQLDRDKVLSLVQLVSAGKVRDLKTLEDLGDDLDKAWSNRNRECHARLLLEICKPLSSGSINDDRRRKVARRYALSALDKPDMIPLVLELKLTDHVMTPIPLPNAPKDKDFSQCRKEDIAVRLHAWKRLIDAIDPKWNPDEAIMAHVDPPLATGLPCGSAPDGVKDAELRAEYEAAIQRNRQKIDRHTEQVQLHRSLETYPKRAEEYILQAYSEPPLNVEELRQLLDVYLTNNETKAQVVNAVEKNIEIQTKEVPNHR